MNNTDKLLRAFIEASGYSIEEITDSRETPIAKHLAFIHPSVLVVEHGAYKRGKDECYYLKPSKNIEYRITKTKPNKHDVNKLGITEHL